jgi:predicted DNA-binding transcriptional regulator YafY
MEASLELPRLCIERVDRTRLGVNLKQASTVYFWSYMLWNWLQARPAIYASDRLRESHMPRGNQIARQWRILRLLESTRTGLRAREIHDALGGGMSERTIFRDLQHLQEAGFPLFFEDESRWRVLTHGEGGYSVPVAPSELLALLLSEELLAPMRSAEVVGALAGLREKVAVMLRPKGRAYAEELKDHFVATFVGPGDYADGSIVPTIEEAIQLEHRLRIGYWSPGRKAGEHRVYPEDAEDTEQAAAGPRDERTERHAYPRHPEDTEDTEQEASSRRGAVTERRVDPYLLWYADARLYLVGHCHLRGAVRTFLVDRIRVIEILDESFDVEPSFDAHKFTGSGMGAWSGERHRVELWFSPAVAHLAHERRFHPSQQVEADAEGGARVIMEVAGLPHVAAWVASFGGQIIARGPAILVQLIWDIGRNSLAAHGGPVVAD